MHAYATDSDRGRLAILVLAVASILSAWALGLLLEITNTQPPWWLDTPAVLGFFGLYWNLYDRIAWRWRWHSLRISDVPNLAGRWDGELRTSYDDSVIPATLTIRQTATCIFIELETENSRSGSFMATLNCQPGTFQGLSYEYENRPRPLSPDPPVILALARRAEREDAL